MGTFRRRMIMSLKKESRLPSAYQEVEYIQSTGTQYIKIKDGQVDSTYGLKLKYSVIGEQDNYVAGFGSTDNKRFLFPTLSKAINNTWRYGWGTYGTGDTTPNYSVNVYPDGLTNVYECELNYMNNKKIKFADNEETTILGANQDFTNTDFYLFKSYSTAMKARIYEAKLSYGTTLIRDLIPCYRKSDYKPGLYDIVEGIFYTNDGEGEFKYPSDFSKFQEVEYIESTGSQYIDTGFNPNKDTSVEVVANWSVVNNTELFGARNNNVLYELLVYTAGTTYYQYGGHSVSSSVPVGTKHTYYANKNKLYCDNHLYITTTAGQNFSITKSLFLMGLNNAGSAQRLSTAKVYSAKIWDNDTLVRNLIPCYCIATVTDVNGNLCQPGTIGMYDSINSDFYTNAGTGTFTKGSDV